MSVTSIKMYPENGQPSEKTPMQEIDDAYKACSFGWFHTKLILVSFLGSIGIVLVTHTTSYLLPIAECDLDMDLVQKGLLNAAPFLGMSTTCLVTGFLTDNFGRIMFLKLGYAGLFFFGIVAGSSQTYAVLVTAKFFEGAFVATSTASNIIYLSEFCHNGLRDRMLICQASFVAMGQIISPAMAMGLLTKEWKWTIIDGYFVLHTWNFYLYAMSLWSLFACIFYWTLPESPKYLVAKQEYEKARAVLIKMYRENTKKPAESYPYIDIWKTEAKQSLSVEQRQGFKRQITAGLYNAKPLFYKPLIVYLLMLGATSFLVTAIYNIMRLWFPQLSTIVEHYKIGANSDLCVLLDNYTGGLKTRNHSTAADVCVPNKSGVETYVNSMIVGLACLISYFITGVLVNRVGKKALFIVSGFIGIGTTLGLRWANSKLAVVSLFSLGTAIMQLMKSLNQATTVEMFPTSVRSFALAMIMMCGRIGTLVGNIGFPLLLDLGCIVPFFSMAGMLIVLTVALFFMPQKKTT